MNPRLRSRTRCRSPQACLSPSVSVHAGTGSGCPRRRKCLRLRTRYPGACTGSSESEDARGQIHGGGSCFRSGDLLICCPCMTAPVRHPIRSRSHSRPTPLRLIPPKGTLPPCSRGCINGLSTAPFMGQPHARMLSLHSKSPALSHRFPAYPWRLSPIATPCACF